MVKPLLVLISNYCKDFYSRLKWFSFKIFCFWNRSKISPEFGWFNYSGICLAPTRIFSSASILPFQEIRERKKNPTCQEIMPKSSYSYIYFEFFNNSSSDCRIILITWTQYKLFRTKMKLLTRLFSLKKSWQLANLGYFV